MVIDRNVYQKTFKIAIVIAIIAFLVFQVLIISVNVKYGSISNIEADNSSVVVSPQQEPFRFYSNSTQVMTDDLFFALGEPLGSSSDNLDLLVSEFTEDRREVQTSQYIRMVPALNSQLSYSGLVFDGNSLWTIGSVISLLDNSTAKLESVMIQFDREGNQLDRIPMPILEISFDSLDEIDEISRTVISISSEKLVFLFQTADRQELVSYSINRPSFKTEAMEVFPGYSNVIPASNLVWFRYPADPYSGDTSDDALLASFNAVPYSNFNDTYVQTIHILSLRSPSQQVPLETVTTDLITQPVFLRDNQYLRISDDQVLLPITIQQFNQSSDVVFYGFDLYQPTTAFFNLINSSLLSVLLLAVIIAIYSKYMITNLNPTSTIEN